MATKNGGKDFWEKLGDSEETLQVKNFFFRRLMSGVRCPRTVSGINVFLPFTQKFKMAAKNGGKTIFGKTCQTEDTLRVKNCAEIALSCTVSERNAFLRFTQKFKMAAKNSS